MTQRAFDRPPPGGSAGYSLVEVMVAMLITCIMLTAVMGVAVTSKQGSITSEHRTLFNQGIAQLTSEVKEYVTACGCDKGTGNCVPALNPTACTQILGPNTNAAGAATWYLNGAAGASGVLNDSMGNVWALTCGDHVITGVVPLFEAPSPYNGTIDYKVGWPGCAANCVGCTGVPAATDVPTITFTANWTEP